MLKQTEVLFLDDEDSVLHDIQRLFNQEPYAIMTTKSADRAMEILREQRIKVVVSDQNMPQIKGVKFLQNIKAYYPDTVRILFASSTDFASAEEAINVGEVYRFISKPLKDTELLSTVRRAIEHYDLIVRAELANQKLKSIYEIQREFTSTVSHELRTPLASIKMAIDLVVKKTLGEINTEQAEVLGRAKKNVDRLKRLIDDILDLTKMEAGKLQMNFMVNDIHSAILEVVEAQKEVAKRRGLEIKTSLDRSIPNISFDSDRIIQILNNLVGNALKFTKQGSVTLKTKNNFEDAYVLISIVDTGKGISEEDLPKLFRKFQQIESAESNEEGGTGLGLAISKEIITRHGGRIWVESKVDKGTTFHFILPLQEQGRGL